MFQDDPYYQEYVDRRQREGYGSSGNRFAPSGPASGTGRVGGSATGKGGAAAKAKKPLEDVEYGYRPDGYKQHSAGLGEDPLSAVRTMRNQMRKMQIEYRNTDRPVKVHLCENACTELTRAEGRLIALNNKKTDALMQGDGKAVEKIRNQMDQIKEDAVRNAYTDLVCDNDQMKAYGVESKWAPTQYGAPVTQGPGPKAPSSKPQEEPDRDQRPSTRSKTPDKRRPSTREQERTPSRTRERPTTKKSERFKPERRPARDPRQSEKRGRTESPDGTIAPPIHSMNQPTEYDPDIKRNDRLTDLLNGTSTNPTEDDRKLLEDNPYKPKTDHGQCPYCEQIQSNFAKKSALDRHLATKCPMMVRCRYCGKVVLVSQLTEHCINRCDFLEDSMGPCPECGMAADKVDVADGLSHPLCRGKPPPDGSEWCPLCAIAVPDNKDAWKKHLTNSVEGCYNNPRLNGTELTIEQERRKEAADRERVLAAQKQKQEEEEAVKKQAAAAEAAKLEESNKKTTTTRKGGGQLAGAKLIDADQLIKALEAAQEKKKAAKKKKMTEIEKKTAPSTSKADPAPANTTPAQKEPAPKTETKVVEETKTTTTTKK